MGFVIEFCIRGLAFCTSFLFKNELGGLGVLGVAGVGVGGGFSASVDGAGGAGAPAVEPFFAGRYSIH